MSAQKRGGSATKHFSFGFLHVSHVHRTKRRSSEPGTTVLRSTSPGAADFARRFGFSSAHVIVIADLFFDSVGTILGDDREHGVNPSFSGNTRTGSGERERLISSPLLFLL